MALLDLAAAPGPARWRTDPAQYWRAIDQAVSERDGPVTVVELSALRANIADLRTRAAAGVRGESGPAPAAAPIRLASKSIRVRGVIDAALAVPGFAGVLAYDVAEAHWLAADRPDRPGIADVLLGYPSADREAIARLLGDEVAAARVSLLVDSPAHLDLIDAAAPPADRPPVRVAIDLDASWRHRLLGHIGVRRSPVHSVGDAVALAETILARPGFRLVGAMSYEAQVAGVGNRAPGAPLRNLLISQIQHRSMRELRERRGATVAALRGLAELEFVNAGGTGSVEATAADPAVTDIAAGSGLFGGHLFDTYRHFRPAPAAAFGLSVVRKPAADLAACHGGGWIASGPPAADRLPKPVWPFGLEYLPREAAGEVQTPLRGPAAAGLAVGDRVWFRHAKSGELAEHANTVLLVDDGVVVGELPTYRGEGRCFL
ncbi:MAG: amino acid deaminase/aldolase [Mycobacteriaceae bacterium]|nr:amino acid deaminase/aldolase [Mycobacteriaceae bacterium]